MAQIHLICRASADDREDLTTAPNGGYCTLASGPLVTLSDKDGPSTGSRPRSLWKAPMIILIDMAHAPDRRQLS